MILKQIIWVPPCSSLHSDLCLAPFRVCGTCEKAWLWDLTNLLNSSDSISESSRMPGTECNLHYHMINTVYIWLNFMLRPVSWPYFWFETVLLLQPMACHSLFPNSAYKESPNYVFAKSAAATTARRGKWVLHLLSLNCHRSRNTCLWGWQLQASFHWSGFLRCCILHTLILLCCGLIKVCLVWVTNDFQNLEY